MADDKNAPAVHGLPLSSSDSSNSDLHNHDLHNHDPRRESLREAVDNAGPIGPAITAFWRSKKTRLDPEAIATQRSVFDNPELKEYFKPHEDYENKHRFDPDERWTWAEELPLIRRLDWKVTLWACTLDNLLSMGELTLEGGSPACHVSS